MTFFDQRAYPDLLSVSGLSVNLSQQYTINLHSIDAHWTVQCEVLIVLNNATDTHPVEQFIIIRLKLPK